jgi:hypothetical protein
LKCGGQGLNITCANRVVLMEPFWNEAVERQAFARTHRKGQEKKCILVRLYVEGTLEERIDEVKVKKESSITNALLKRDVTPALNIFDYLRYIGVPVSGADGKLDVRLFVDDEDDEFTGPRPCKEEPDDEDKKPAVIRDA